MNEIIYSKQAFKILKTYDRKTVERIKKKIDTIPDGDIKRLEGQNIPPLYRLRLGKYRIIYQIDNTSKILILKIDTRGDVYK